MGKRKNDDEVDKRILEARLEEIGKYEKSADYIADKINRQNEKLCTINEKIKNTKLNLEMLDFNDEYDTVKKAYYTSYLEQLYEARQKAQRGLEAYENSYYALSILLEQLRSELNS
ncbi:MAG: hypothetical protein MJ246_06610 [Clostridia bacterium]|nr:hypothetical protein [Clostridia bacterium]